MASVSKPAPLAKQGADPSCSTQDAPGPERRNIEPYAAPMEPMDGPPQITIKFPGTPEFLRLARLTSADAGSPAGFDYEDIDDRVSP